MCLLLTHRFSLAPKCLTSIRAIVCMCRGWSLRSFPKATRRQAYSLLRLIILERIRPGKGVRPATFHFRAFPSSHPHWKNPAQLQHTSLGHPPTGQRSPALLASRPMPVKALGVRRLQCQALQSPLVPISCSFSSGGIHAAFTFSCKILHQ